MIKKALVRLLLAILGGLYCPYAAGREVHEPEPSEPTAIMEYEAEILIAVHPSVLEARAAGEDVGLWPESGDHLNLADFFFFIVKYNEGPGDTDLIAHLAVNRHTCDVVDYVGLSGEVERGRELEAIQEILRRAHGIDEAVIRKYRDRFPWSEEFLRKQGAPTDGKRGGVVSRLPWKSETAYPPGDIT